MLSLSASPGTLGLGPERPFSNVLRPSCRIESATNPRREEHAAMTKVQPTRIPANRSLDIPFGNEGEPGSGLAGPCSGEAAVPGRQRPATASEGARSQVVPARTPPPAAQAMERLGVSRRLPRRQGAKRSIRPWRERTRAVSSPWRAPAMPVMLLVEPHRATGHADFDLRPPAPGTEVCQSLPAIRNPEPAHLIVARRPFNSRDGR